MGVLLRKFWDSRTACTRAEVVGQRHRVFVGQDNGFFAKGDRAGMLPIVAPGVGTAFRSSPSGSPSLFYVRDQASEFLSCHQDLWTRGTVRGLLTLLLLHSTRGTPGGWGHRGLKKLGPVFQEASSWEGRETRKGEQASSMDPVCNSR